MPAFLKRIFSFFTAITAFFSGLFGLNKKPADPASEPTQPDGQVPALVFQAHRGLSSEYPENTLAAFRAAGEAGFGCIELDPAVTKDGRVVVLHDAAVNRTCRHPDGTGLAEPTAVSELTYEELTALDAGLYFGEVFRGEKVPLLTEALALARSYGMKVKIDNKVEGFSAADRERVFSAAEGFEDTAEFTAKTLGYAEAVLGRFPASVLHYDGPVTEDILRSLSALRPKEMLTVWLPLDTPGTAWSTLPKANAQSCAAVKQHARLGLWILTLPEELEAARALRADIIETPGQLRP